MKGLLIGLAATLHLLPHPFGVSPIGATAIYAGAHGHRNTYWLIPWIPITLGLLVSGWFEPIVMVAVFLGFSLAAVAARWLLRRPRAMANYGFAVLVGATIFYLVSNFSVWLAGFYPPTMAGLAACYLAGLPYLGLAIVADAAYCWVLFGLHTLIDHTEPEPIAA